MISLPSVLQEVAVVIGIIYRHENDNRNLDSTCPAAIGMGGGVCRALRWFCRAYKPRYPSEDVKARLQTCRALMVSTSMLMLADFRSVAV